MSRRFCCRGIPDELQDRMAQAAKAHGTIVGDIATKAFNAWLEDPENQPGINGLKARALLAGELLAWRNKKGFIQRMVAARLGISQSLLSEIEIGIRVPSPKLAQRIRVLLKIEVPQLPDGA